jgi:hypothetical protein
VLALAMPAFGQVSVTNANSFDLDNGAEAFLIFTATTTATTGNVAGTGVVNTTPNDQMWWNILPRELMNSSNGTAPGTMELVTQEYELIHSFWGSGGAGGTPGVDWDQTINPVTYINPISGLGPDGRRYPDLAVAPLVTILGGPTGLPAPAGCAAPQYWGYILGVEYGTATPGSGIILPADGATDLAWCFWSPGGMTATPADPSGCEVGGNLSSPSLVSANLTGCLTCGERVAAGVTTGAATPLPTGVDRNPLTGTRNITAAAPTAFNNSVRDRSFYNWPGFREPILQGRFNAASFAAPERGAGTLFLDTPGLGAVFPGFRTTATGHLGELVVHVASLDPVTFTPFTQPGLPVTGTSNLLLNPADPNFLLLTPILDGLTALNAAATGDYVWDKHVYDTPLVIPVGPFSPAIPPPGLTYLVQAFVVNFAVSPVGVVSSNVFTGNLR